MRKYVGKVEVGQHSEFSKTPNIEIKGKISFHGAKNKNKGKVVKVLFPQIRCVARLTQWIDPAPVSDSEINDVTKFG